MRHRFRSLVLIALAMLWPAIESRAQTVQIVRESAEVIAVTGGSGAQTWRLRYGVLGAFQQLLVEVSPTRTYFVNGSWLRLIDTEQGVVLGRWRFPQQILEITKAAENGLAVRVRFKLSPAAGVADRVVAFDPATAVVPTWELGSLLSYRIAETEAVFLLSRLPRAGDRWSRVTQDAAATAVPALEEMVKRDPTAPWMRLALGKLLSDAEDPRGRAVMGDAVRTAGDFSELFMMSSRLVPLGQPELSSLAYDRAFTNFLARGRDPRLFTFLISRLVLYSPFGLTPDSLSEPERRLGIERIYQLAPTIEGADVAWAQYAAYLERKGDREDAALWRRRAEFAQRESLYLGSADLYRAHDRLLLVAAGSALASALLIWALYVKYAPERRMRTMAAARTSRALSMGFVNLEYWSRQERAALLLIAMVGWLACGLESVYVRAALRAASDPVRVGEISGPDDIAFIRERLPASAERDLLLAIAHQTTGELSEAEGAYRALPQFAESWNNLGVILTQQGKTTEARQAFVRALEASPVLAEAILNTGGAPQSQATEVHQKYVPDTAMIAIPGREHFFRAYMGPTWTGRYWRSLLGPLAELADLSRQDIVGHGPALLVGRLFRFLPDARLPTGWIGLLMLAVAGLSLGLWAFVPFREVTQPPGRFARVLALMLPGVSPSWRWMGGPVLLISCVLATALVLQLTYGSPYVLTAVAQVGLMRAFGLPAEALVPSDAIPPIAVAGIMLAALVLVNWFVIRKERAR